MPVRRRKYTKRTTCAPKRRSRKYVKRTRAYPRKLTPSMKPEKKIGYSYINGVAFGQVDGNTSGHLGSDVTPLIDQGADYDEQVGHRVNLTGAVVTLQFEQQSATIVTGKVRWLLVEVLGPPTGSAPTFVTQMFRVNPLIYLAGSANIFDYFSSYNPDYRQQFKVHASRTIVIPRDPYSGSGSQKTVKIPIRFNKGKGHQLRTQFSGVTATGPISGQLLMVFLCDIGNKNASTACTLTGPNVKAVSTGYTVSAVIQYWYTDL